MAVQQGSGPVDSGTQFRTASGESYTTSPGPGGTRVVNRQGKPSSGGGASPAPAGTRSNPVFYRFAAPELSAAQIAKQRLSTPTRIGTPVAILMLAGLGLVWYALHSWDQKYSMFNGHFAGSAYAKDQQQAPAPAPAAPSGSVSQTA